MSDNRFSEDVFQSWDESPYGSSNWTIINEGLELDTVCEIVISIEGTVDLLIVVQHFWLGNTFNREIVSKGSRVQERSVDFKRKSTFVSHLAPYWVELLEAFYFSLIVKLGGHM